MDNKESPVLKKTRLNINRWSLFGLLAATALFTILYVSNVIAVNRLMRATPMLELKRDALMYEQQKLEKDIARLQSADRISALAQSRFKMIPNPNAPKTLSVAK